MSAMSSIVSICVDDMAIMMAAYVDRTLDVRDAVEVKYAGLSSQLPSDSNAKGRQKILHGEEWRVCPLLGSG